MEQNLTPMMLQYKALKEKHQDAVLFFRLGDFYEMFSADALEASSLLELTLTKRNGVPMCGIPYHAATNYIARLIKAGKKIAICEQTSQPKPGKGLVSREVVEIITPGTLLDENLLERTTSNYLVSLYQAQDQLALAAVEFSTARLLAMKFPVDKLLENVKRELYRLNPSEIIIEEFLYERESALSRLLAEHENLLVNRYPLWSFEQQTNYELLCRQFKVTNLKAFGLSKDSIEVPALGVIIAYLEETSKSKLQTLTSIELINENNYLQLDEATQKNLELIKNLQDGSKRYTLFEVLNHTKTAMGARNLANWLLQPLRNKGEIDKRLEIVEYFYRHQLMLNAIREELGHILDLERLSSRVAAERAHPKDLVAIKNSIFICQKIFTFLKKEELPAELSNILNRDFNPIYAIADLIDKALVDEPPLSITEGNIIKTGYNPDLDRLRHIRDNAQSLLDAYLEEERKTTQIPNLKLRYNRIIGYYFELTKSQRPLLPKHFILRQSLVSGDRYTTEKLADLESEINTAQEKVCELEKELFLEIRNSTKQMVTEILKLGKEISTLDTLQAFAYAATLYAYTRPQIADDTTIEIIEGRHPVVEAQLPAGAFVPNSLKLDPSAKSFIILTGPNMAGKSTFLRQTALIVLMAQIGSFVPAQSAHIGLVDKIFCRVGAFDNLARGESTFLIEMNETAYILRRSTPNSLIIMDEVGRGTSTADGLAIAKAVIYYILEKIEARTLFATHFHELSAIQHKRLTNLSLEVCERDNQIIFLKRIKKGPADRSYGIQVAQLAGLPPEVIALAKHLQNEGLTNNAVSAQNIEEIKEKLKKDVPLQPTLFSAPELILEEILAIEVEKTRPLDALALIEKWQIELKKQ